MEFKISYLEEKDLKECYDLCERCFHENGTMQEVQKIYHQFKDNPMYKFIVAKVDNKIVGYTTMIIIHYLFDGKPLATLWYVCVDSNYRRMGIATKIFEKIELIAKEENCSLIYFTSAMNNSNAHKFYNDLQYDDTVEKAFYNFF